MSNASTITGAKSIRLKVQGPRGNLLLGSTLDFMRSPLKFIQRMAAEYGEVAHFRHIAQRYRLQLLPDREVTTDPQVTQCPKDGLWMTVGRR